MTPDRPNLAHEIALSQIEASRERVRRRDAPEFIGGMLEFETEAERDRPTAFRTIDEYQSLLKAKRKRGK